jgi:hypothetical protein
MTARRRGEWIMVFNLAPKHREFQVDTAKRKEVMMVKTRARKGARSVLKGLTLAVMIGTLTLGASLTLGVNPALALHCGTENEGWGLGAFVYNNYGFNASVNYYYYLQRRGCETPFLRGYVQGLYFAIDNWIQNCLQEVFYTGTDWRQCYQRWRN